MNCKPGDLAVITRVFLPDDEWAVGMTVTCIRIVPGTGDCWEVDREIVDPRGARYGGVWDCVLRPITPPAGEVTDTEVRDLYAPKRATETA